MVFKNFKINVFFRLILLSASLFLTYITFYFYDYHMTPVLLAILTIIQFYSLFHYIQKTNQILSIFLDSIRYADFSRNFKIEGLGSKYDVLKDSFNSVITEFQKIRTDKMQHYHYLQNVIQHVAVGLIAFDGNGNIELVNNSARKMLQIHKLKNITDLKKISDDMPEKLKKLKSADRALIKINDNEKTLQLIVYATEFKLTDRNIKLVSLQNIQSELEEQELASWQKLISVLTHEIMNSITPIASLSATVNQMMEEYIKDDDEPVQVDAETIDDIKSSLITINKRSMGLVHFVKSYRSITKVPKPDFAIVPVKDLFVHINNLFEDEMKEKGISFSSLIEPSSLEVTIDPDQIEQVLINLIKNAMHALAECNEPEIKLKAFLGDKGKVVIQVSDNGPGILEEVLDKIFIPFFTTKATGSGIGLSLSKQIMRVHGGSISATSTPYKQTAFTLKF